MKKIISILLLAIGSAAIAQADTQGYLTDSNGQIVRSGAGLCWHTGYWTPANAVEGCDPIAKKNTPISNRVSIQAETLFDFNKATLKPDGIVVLNSIIGDLMSLATVDLLAITGYTDRIGSDEYNLALSQKRADEIKNYLVAAGIDGDDIITIGRGKANPVTGVTCKGYGVTRKLIQCLSPDRRAVIEILGTK